MVRSGLQKEGSRVIFGVPKPGKKRKFMDVSKHYVAHGSSKANDKNDSGKIANFSMPQGSELRGWRNSSKNDTKEKLGADSKPKTKFGKPQGVLGRVNPPRNTSVSNTETAKDSSNHFKNASQSESQAERASNTTTDGVTQVPIVFSSLATSTDTRPTKRTFTSRASKGKLAPASKLRKGGGGKALNDKPTKSTSESDVLEPRRSNRRIQPTSRDCRAL
ncbi:serine-rich adhesin for platelets-like [Trifolium medium]|uniref:Serine-rich adhesin for platelets-like n=1 Tax=Trifolium medium TaxID=97028 RepID=A0A392PDX2_9FABA|nr:serine-rich adhesin for platelets-like [Trifolium medium]